MGIIQRIHGLDGKLSRSNSMLMNSLLHQPTLSLWRSAKNMVISEQPLITLNVAVRAVTQGQVVIEEFPDTFTLYRALKFAIEKREHYYHKMEVCDTES